MIPLDKEKILDAIRKEHGLVIDSKDPIFAVLIANEIILSRHTNALEAFLLQQKIEIESINLSSTGYHSHRSLKIGKI